MAAIQNFQLSGKFAGRTLRPRATLRKRSTRRPDMRAATPLTHLLLAITLLTVGPLLFTSKAEARITRVQITAHESPTFGGYSWPGVGQYEKIVGIAFGEVDPTNPQNAVIADIAMAPRNGRGNVEYSFDFYILKPIDLSKGNHRVMYEPPNRGRKTWASLGRVTVDPGGNGNDPGSAITDPAVLANAFLMPRGFTMVWSGWDASAGNNGAGFNTRIGGPTGPSTLLAVAKNPDGSTITGPAFEYIVTSGTNPFTLTYPAASLNKSAATLTHRVHLDDVPVTVPASGWTYNATGTSINLVPPGWVNQDIYEFSYTAKNPTVNGLGFAAVRDWNAWLRYETDDGNGTANPLAGDIQRIFTEISSQPGRFLNDFRHLGFNQAENGRQVFDGLMQWIAAGDGINMNYRWSQPGRTERNRQDHLFAEGVFPFANVTTTDPFTGKTDSRLTRCEATHTCPVAVEIYSANEFWVKAGSLMTTTPDGTADLPDPPFARNYFISSHQHGVGSATSKGNCQQFQNPLDSAPIQRALFLALDAWLDGTLPPATRVPRLADGTLVPPLPQAGMGFPNIPGVTYTGLKTTRYLFNYGPDYYTTGVPTINPPMITPPYEDNPLNGHIYPSFIPKTDSDGNDIAGVRLPDVTVPLATYTGWALRAGPQANDGCESSGQYIPFLSTKAQRLAAGDPRPSIEERYPSYAEYRSAVMRAIDNLVKDGFMLCEDADDALTRLLQAGLTAGVPAPKGNPAPQSTVPQCLGNGPKK
jgi:Alpha/beta hydrolase domain